MYVLKTSSYVHTNWDIYCAIGTVWMYPTTPVASYSTYVCMYVCYALICIHVISCVQSCAQVCTYTTFTELCMHQYLPTYVCT